MRDNGASQLTAQETLRKENGKDGGKSLKMHYIHQWAWRVVGLSSGQDHDTSLPDPLPHL